MTVNSFFAGIGGFDLGFENEGFRVKFQCEVNDFCVQILKHNWPNTLLANDIRNVDADSIPKSTIWCGGFPCQDVSVARGSNGRDGLNGKNSGLFYDFLNLIQQKRPKVLILENVTGLLNSHNGKDFKIIIDALTSLGYGVSWRILNTKYFGTPQSRPRVYICAWKDNLFNAASVLYERKSSSITDNMRGDFLNFDVDETLGLKVPKISYCLAASSGRHTGTDWSRTYVSYYDNVRRFTPVEAERLQGFPSNWTLPEHFDKKFGELDSLRYHAIGNAVSVPVVQWIARKIKNRLKEKSKEHSISEIIKKFADFSTNDNTKEKEPILLSQDQEKLNWLNGGIAFGSKIVQIKANSFPNEAKQSRVIDLLERQPINEKYFLSPSAAKGIIRRVKAQKRTLIQPLEDALNRLASKQSTIKENTHEFLRN